MNEIIVKKFGGNSIGALQSRRDCIKYINSDLEKGKKVVLVLSAMGSEGDAYATDTLLSLVDTRYLGPQEADLLMSTGEVISSVVFSNMLTEIGIDNKVLTGKRAGIITNGNFNQSLIKDVATDEIEKVLEEYNVAIIPGFQGVDEDDNVTTLGRGGSDTSAVAIAVALNAEIVEIYTDVDGIASGDPKVVENPRYLQRISYDDVSQLANNGVKAIHPRAVEMAKKNNLKIRIRSFVSSNEGTLITMTESEDKIYGVRENILTGITSTKRIAYFTIQNSDEDNENYRKLFELLKEEKISIDFFNVTNEKVSFTVTERNARKLEVLLVSIGLRFDLNEKVSKVAVVGSAINGVPGVMSEIMEVMLKESIGVYQTADSNNTIWLLVDKDKNDLAVKELHNKFFSIEMQ